eukprot:UN06127
MKLYYPNPDEVIFLSDMTVLSHVRAATSFKGVLHPQYESVELRKRVRDSYLLFACPNPTDVVSTMRKYNATALIMNAGPCGSSNAMMHNFLEKKHRCRHNHPDFTERFCWSGVIDRRYFEIVYHNPTYWVVELKKER